MTNGETSARRRRARPTVRVLLAVTVAAQITTLAGINWGSACNEPLWASWTVPLFFVSVGLAVAALVAGLVIRAFPEAVGAFFLSLGCYGIYALLALAGLGDAC